MFHTHTYPEYLTSDLISGAVVHCFSTRRGGVSTGHLSSLNLGVHRGDDWNNVYENYRRLGAAVGFTPEQTVFTHQTHTDRVARVGAEDRGWGLFREVEPERDGIYTNEPGVALVCFSADCTPILLHDPVRHAVAAVHSGWRGTALGIAARCVEAMTREFGTDPADLQAAIGPCIGPCCFETGPEVPAAVLSGDLVLLPERIAAGLPHPRVQIPGAPYCRMLFPSLHAAVETVGALLASGDVRILIGTRALLGEGWDAPCVNTLILASTVGSFVQSNQMRGRAIRIDPAQPDKTANIRHLVIHSESRILCVGDNIWPNMEGLDLPGVEVVARQSFIERPVRCLKYFLKNDSES